MEERAGVRGCQKSLRITLSPVTVHTHTAHCILSPVTLCIHTAQCILHLIAVHGAVGCSCTANPTSANFSSTSVHCSLANAAASEASSWQLAACGLSQAARARPRRHSRRAGAAQRRLLLLRGERQNLW